MKRKFGYVLALFGILFSFFLYTKKFGGPSQGNRDSADRSPAGISGPSRSPVGKSLSHPSGLDPLSTQQAKEAFQKKDSATYSKSISQTNYKIGKETFQFVSDMRAIRSVNYSSALGDKVENRLGYTFFKVDPQTNTLALDQKGTLPLLLDPITQKFVIPTGNLIFRSASKKDVSDIVAKYGMTVAYQAPHISVYYLRVLPDKNIVDFYHKVDSEVRAEIKPEIHLLRNAIVLY